MHRRARWRIGRIDLSVLLYAAAMLLACVAAQRWRSWLEWSGLLCLMLVYLVFRHLLRRDEGEEGRRTVQAFIWSGVIAASLGNAGWLLTGAGVDTPLARSTDLYYPYLGHVGRTSGLTTSPTMLMSLLSSAFLLKMAEVTHRRTAGRWDAVALAVLAVGIVLTFSKAIVALGISLVWMLHRADRGSSRLRRYAVAATIAALLVIFLDRPARRPAYSALDTGRYAELTGSRPRPCPVNPGAGRPAPGPAAG